jgi:hypothetical protein
MAKRGSRLITIDGYEYRWKERSRPTCCQGLAWSPLTFVAEHAEQPGARLVVSLPCAHPSNWLMAPAGAVLPSTVASAIKSALNTGWRPTRPAPSAI